MHIAVIGAGPSGFYAAAQLLKNDIHVDLLDRLPTPFGLVRTGVAPDHPKIKAVTAAYTTIAEHPALRFFGGVELGSTVTRDELRERYHAVVYALGTPHDRPLEVPGSDLCGVHAATDFVGWYNGHPDFTEHHFELTGRRAVVIGNGNVAIDVTRMLSLGAEQLGVTDCADHAIAALTASSITTVTLIGRRGPAQAAFTNPELREIAELPDTALHVDRSELELDLADEAWLAGPASTIQRRNLDTLRDLAAQPRPTGTRHIELRFRLSPLEILGQDRVEGIRVTHNRLEMRGDALIAVPTGHEEIIDCDVVLSAIGHRGTPVDSVPFDHTTGRIPNDRGRVCDESGARLSGEYTVGWIKRGPSGVIGTNKKDAAETAAAILEDIAAGRLDQPGLSDPASWLLAHAPSAVTWGGWKAIDAHEIRAGVAHGRPRVKLVNIAGLHDIATRTTHQPTPALR